MKRRYLHCYDYYKTALDEQTLFEDEMNNVGTARKRTATSATTKKKKKGPQNREKLVYRRRKKMKINACETTK